MTWVILALLGADARWVLASNANVRATADAKAAVVRKVPIATEVSVLETKDGWARLSDGWVLAELLGAEKPTLEAMNAKFEAAPKNEKRKWAERAAALAPKNVAIVQRLVGILETAGDDKALEQARIGLAAARAAAGKISIGAVHARLVYEKGGDNSECLFENENLLRGLWNTIIGEGSSGGSSTSTALEVEVYGPPGKATGTLLVEAKDASRKKPQLKKSVKLEKLDADGHATFEFEVPQTGCDTLNIKAQLGDSVVTEFVPFNCGE